MKKGIRLSPKHGVNPTIPLCFFCNEPKNEVILAGLLPGDAEAPRAAVWTADPCDTCAGYMQQGILLISARDGERGDNPYRTGGWVVVKPDLIERVIANPEAREQILRRRFAFVPDSAWDQIGLPRAADPAAPERPEPAQDGPASPPAVR